MQWANERLLILSPHPDDEVIGCGGLISRVKRVGGEVFVLFVTVGDTNDASANGRSTAGERLAEIEQVADLLKFDGHDVALAGNEFHLGLDTLPRRRLLALIEEDSPLSIRRLQPSVVLLPQLSSYNQDHSAVARAAISALRPGDAQFRHQPSTVLAYEQVADGWMPEPQRPPDVFVELTDADLDLKLKALSAYASQRREHPNTRSSEALRGLAIVRGAQCGVPLAEAFQCLRMRI